MNVGVLITVYSKKNAMDCLVDKWGEDTTEINYTLVVVGDCVCVIPKPRVVKQI